jgi:hypothetical protein
MRQLIFVSIFFLLSKTFSFGQDIDTASYIGISTNSSSNGTVLSKSLILLERIQNPSTKQIIINTVLIDTAGKVTRSPSLILMVNDKNEFTISDTKGTTSGNGKLFGTPWNWTYLSGEYKTVIGLTIKDEDFFSDLSVLASRKEFILPNGVVLMTMDITATKISRTEYNILIKALK